MPATFLSRNRFERSGHTRRRSSWGGRRYFQDVARVTIFMDKFSPAEQDIQIQASALFDYLRDLLILAGHEMPYSPTYQAARLQFGEHVVELVRAIRSVNDDDAPI